MTFLATWVDKGCGRLVDVGSLGSKSLFQNASEDEQYLIRTGKTRAGAGKGQKRKNVPADQAAALTGGKTWGWKGGRFLSTTVNTGGGYRFVSPAIHAASIGGLPLPSTDPSIAQFLGGIMSALVLPEGDGMDVDEVEVEAPVTPTPVTNEEDLDELDEDTITTDSSYEARMEAINSVVSKAVAAIDDIPSIIPKDNNDSGIFEPVVEALFFGIPTIPQGELPMDNP